MLKSLTEAHSSGKKQFALLLDPDHIEVEGLANTLALAQGAGIDHVLVGGSLVGTRSLDELVRSIKGACTLPVSLFPGHPVQLTDEADALLLLSLISGRNAEYLIGHHVISAPLLQQMDLEVVPTGYMLVDCGRQTSVSYISGTTPLPYDKPELAAYTALAGQYLGMQCIYMDGGSGAMRPISPKMIAAVRNTVKLPIVVGGGLSNPTDIHNALAAGADCVVVGTAIERDQSPDLLLDLVQAVRQFESVTE